MPEAQFGTAPVIKVAGTELPADLDPLVVAVRIDSDLNAPGSCVIVLADPTPDVFDKMNASFGQDIEVSASPVEESSESKIFEGKIYGLEFEADEAGNRVLVRAYDGSFPLRQHRDVAVFIDVTDDDVINNAASSAGVKLGTIDTGSVVHPYVAQHNETTWDFIRRRARLNNCMVYMKDGKLQVTKRPEASGAPSPGGHDSSDPLQLAPGSSLQYLRVGASSVQQVGKIETRGWDPETQREVTATATPRDTGAESTDKPDRAGDEVGTPERIVSMPGLTTTNELQAMADSMGSMVASSMAYLEGRAAGDPRLQAGVAISIGETGRFDGKYTITSAHHEFGPDGYHTDITVSGDHDRSIYGVASAGTRASGLDGMTDVAVVTDINDPDGQGRVKVTYKWMSDNHVSHWARVSHVGAGDERGIFWMPEVEDEVLVTYLRGDRDFPIVIGSLYNGKAKPIDDAINDGSDNKIDQRILRSRIGHRLHFDDTDGSEKITIETGNGNVMLELDDAGKKLTIKCEGDVDIKSKGNVNLENQGNATVKSSGNLDCEASANLTVKAGGTLKLEGGAQVDISGPTVKVGQMVQLG